MQVFDMQPDAPGIWMLHCHVDDHMMAGMGVLYRVTGEAAQACPVSTGTQR
jgi:hephaestin